jgi:hypothetical protein
MKTVYEALRDLLRGKELEIKRLEKEIEALRIVLPIVADSKETVDSEEFRSKQPFVVEGAATPKAPGYVSPELEAVLSKTSTSNQSAANSAAEGAKHRTSWP